VSAAGGMATVPNHPQLVETEVATATAEDRNEKPKEIVIAAKRPDLFR